MRTLVGHSTETIDVVMDTDKCGDVNDAKDCIGDRDEDVAFVNIFTPSPGVTSFHLDLTLLVWNVVVLLGACKKAML